MKVLNFGSLNIDYVYCLDHFVKAGETISSDELHVYSGGKGLNQSIAMGKAGVTVYHAGAIGKDGQFLVELLQKSNVNTEFIRVSEDVRTGNAIIQKDKLGDNSIILFGGANQSINRDFVDNVISQFNSGDYIVLQNEINELKYIVESAYKQGMKIVLNPSPMNEKILELPLEEIDYFILNEIEATQILGYEVLNKMSDDELADRLVVAFPNSRIVLTLGERGSMYVDTKTKVKQKIYQTKAVDTTAAGDTFTGYFVASLINDMTVEDSMDRASKASSIAVSRMGAAPSIPTCQEVELY